MQKARIDEQGRLEVKRRGQYVSMSCRFDGGSGPEYNYTNGPCSHDCPGWEEEQARDMVEPSGDEPGSNVVLIRKPHTVTLKCMPGEPVYEIVEDERVGG